jgi:hypothetical protein
MIFLEQQQQKQICFFSRGFSPYRKSNDTLPLDLVGGPAPSELRHHFHLCLSIKWKWFRSLSLSLTSSKREKMWSWPTFSFVSARQLSSLTRVCTTHIVRMIKYLRHGTIRPTAVFWSMFKTNRSTAAAADRENELTYLMISFDVLLGWLWWIYNVAKVRGGSALMGIDFPFFLA